MCVLAGSAKCTLCAAGHINYAPRQALVSPLQFSWRTSLDVNSLSESVELSAVHCVRSRQVRQEPGLDHLRHVPARHFPGRSRSHRMHGTLSCVAARSCFRFHLTSCVDLTLCSCARRAASRFRRTRLRAPPAVHFALSSWPSTSHRTVCVLRVAAPGRYQDLPGNSTCLVCPLGELGAPRPAH